MAQVINLKIGTTEVITAGRVVQNVTASPGIIIQNSTNRFVTDAEKSTWNGKDNVHSNRASLDTINQSLGTGNAPTFISLNLSEGIGQYKTDVAEAGKGATMQIGTGTRGGILRSLNALMGVENQFLYANKKYTATVVYGDASVPTANELAQLYDGRMDSALIAPLTKLPITITVENGTIFENSDVMYIGLSGWNGNSDSGGRLTDYTIEVKDENNVWIEVVNRTGVSDAFPIFHKLWCMAGEETRTWVGVKGIRIVITGATGASWSTTNLYLTNIQVYTTRGSPPWTGVGALSIGGGNIYGNLNMKGSSIVLDDNMTVDGVDVSAFKAAYDAHTHDFSATFAPIAKGVTNGDAHDHSGGDGAQIAYSSLSGLPTIPDQLSDLTGDATHRLVTDTEKSTWNGKAEGTHSHGTLDNSTALTGANVYSLVTTVDGIVTGLTTRAMTAADVGASASTHAHGTYDRATSVLSGANVFSDVIVTDGIVTGISTRALTAANIGAAASSHNHAATEITSGTLDGDRLPALSTTKKGGVPATGTPSGKFLKDDGTWATPAAGGAGALSALAIDDDKDWGKYAIYNLRLLITNPTYNPDSVDHLILMDGNSHSMFSVGIGGVMSGSNAGADLYLWKYTDAGDRNGMALAVSRATGKLYANGGIEVTDTLNIQGSVTNGTLTIDGSDVIAYPNGYRELLNTAVACTMIVEDASNRFVTDTEKSTWNSKAAGTHTHVAADVTSPSPTGKFLKDDGTWDTPAGGSGALSTLTIDADKNWNAKSLSNVNNLQANGTMSAGGACSLNNVLLDQASAAAATTGGARLGRADRALGNMVVQLGGTGTPKFEILDKGWTTVVLSVDNSGNTKLGGYLDCQENRMFRAYKTGGNQAYYATSWVELTTISGENYDDHASFNNGVFTAPRAGTYLFETQVSFIGTELGATFQIELNSNLAGGVARDMRCCAINNYVRLTTIRSVSANETFRVKCHCSHDGIIEAGDDKTFFSAHLLTDHA